MNIEKLLKHIKYENINGAKLSAEITALCDDTRKITKGCLFFCIKGIRVDPHKMIKEIEEKGAAAVLTDNEADITGVKIPVLRTDNTRSALSVLAVKFYYHQDELLRLIGITGTNGKTSTSYFTEALLIEAGKRTAVIGTVGVKENGRDLGIEFTTATTPDTLELIDIFKKLADMAVDTVVMEVSSHSLALNKVEGLSFKVGVFTNLTQDHLDFHETMENYFDAKAKLFNLCEYGVINADDEWGKKLIKISACKTLTYGISPECDFRAVNIKYSPDGVNYELKYLESYVDVYVPVPGTFTVYNSLAAIAAGFALNIPLGKIISAVSKIKPVPGRIQSIPNNKKITIIVDYAHTPDSLRAIINSVRDFSKKVITVFGCGGDRDNTKRPVMGEIAGKFSDYCVITSDNPRSEEPMDIINQIETGIIKTNCPFEKTEDRRQAIYSAISRAEEGDTVIIAGKGHEDYQEIKGIKHHFNDAEVVREICKAGESI
ncbi:MAG: UDP-N-acetylmuramoyl-L-alanyl-D-glutamate--2,6-diaminopimelate ligase [Clostridiales bacterium]|jgi:UDP-N-acetylmuramoyl-L-alanyl-D-glutamate--2,6-diaminopimelate ligase|nr:UDP-N-acetylmuramoyl-L-alanyl-D-glutamate--2,6-diaminopimelate ligase [Clostridiales bacterium]